MSYKIEKNGWVFVHIEGKPYERGVEYGKLVADQLKICIDTTKFYCLFDYGQDWDFFVESAKEIYKKPIQDNYPELYDEMRGIADGCKKAGFETSLDEIIAWNSVLVIFDYWWPNAQENKVIIPSTLKKHVRSGGSRTVNIDGAPGRCSAFIAVGNDYTKDGKIVLAHNTFENFVSGQYCNYIVSIKPENGSEIIMQTQPGFIWSGTDFFVSKNEKKGTNFIGSETTIGGFLPYELGNPVFCRIRKGMQYAEKLEDFETFLLDGNTGGYANSWIFGDIKENKIMRIELGLKYHNTEYKTNGYFIGFNGSYDARIRNLECRAQGYLDIRRHQGARHVRLEQLIEKYKGKLDIHTAKIILSDHYDVYLKKINPCSRTVDSHYELDDRAFMSQSDRPKPFQPRGAMDGKCVDSHTASKGGFYAKWGSSSNIPFYKEPFLKKNPIWNYLKDYLLDRPNQEWTLFHIDDKNKKIKKRSKTLKKSKTSHKNKTKKNRKTI